MSDYEQEKAQYDADLIDAQDRYFNARPKMSRSSYEERIFDGGFRLGREKMILPPVTNQRP